MSRTAITTLHKTTGIAWASECGEFPFADTHDRPAVVGITMGTGEGISQPDTLHMQSMRVAATGRMYMVPPNVLI